MIAAGAIPAADIRVGSQQALAVYAGDELVWIWPDELSVDLAFSAGTTISISLRSKAKQEVFATTAFPVIISWGDGSTTVIEGEMEQVGAYYFYTGTANHLYSPGTHTMRFFKPGGGERLRGFTVRQDDGKADSITEIDSKRGSWLLPSINTLRNKAINLRTVNAGDSIADTTGFSNCTALSNLTFGSNAVIGELAFSGCTALGPNLEIGGKSFGYQVFADCSGLRKVWIRESVQIIKSHLFDSDAYVGQLPLETIYCEADSKPDGWVTGWNQSVGGSSFPVVWGQKTRPW